MQELNIAEIESVSGGLKMQGRESDNVIVRDDRFFSHNLRTGAIEWGDTFDRYYYQWF